MQLASRPALARLAVIDQAIREGGWPNASTLARSLEVSSRTVQRDLEFLRDRLQAPLHYDPVRNGYCYNQPDYRLPYFRLTEGELLALFLAERFLRQYRGSPYEGELQRAFAKIVQALPETVSIDLSAVAGALSAAPTSVPMQDSETLRGLASAALRGRRLEVDYWTASRDEVTRRQVDPYHLTRIDSDWYLIGYCHLRRDVRMFSAVRVRSLRETGETFARPREFRVEDYLGESFRVVRGEGRYRVVLRFTQAFAGRIAEKVWHPTHTTERTDDGGMILRLTVSDLREVVRWVLSWGAECEVLKPAQLRRRVRDEMRKILGKYDRQSSNAR